MSTSPQQPGRTLFRPPALRNHGYATILGEVALPQPSDWLPGPLPKDVSGQAPELSLLLPCHNEAGNVSAMHAAVTQALPGISLEIIFIDDGSQDGTASAVEALRRVDARVKLLCFVANAGHQSALRAGYRAARGRFIASLDADGQHPPECLPAMLAKAREGAEVVQMVRRGDQGGLTKNLLSRAFYRIFNVMADSPMPPAGSDFRLISRYVGDTLNALPERHLVLRAILPALGFRITVMEYDLRPREHGQSAYSFTRSWRLMSDSLFNFSTLPLRLMRRVGLAISVLAFVYGVYNVAMKFFGPGNVPGYTDIVASVLFLGGLILLYLGVLGRYLEIAIDHLRNRPEYLLRPEASPKTMPTAQPISEKASPSTFAPYKQGP